MKMPKIPKKITYPLIGLAALGAVTATNFDFRYNCTEAFNNLITNPIKRYFNSINHEKARRHFIDKILEKGVYDIKHEASEKINGNRYDVFSGKIGNQTTEICIYNRYFNNYQEILISCRQLSDSLTCVRNNTRPPASDKIVINEDTIKTLSFPHAFADTKTNPFKNGDEKIANVLEKMREFMKEQQRSDAPKLTDDMKQKCFDLYTWKSAFEQNTREKRENKTAHEMNETTSKEILQEFENGFQKLKLNGSYNPEPVRELSIFEGFMGVYPIKYPVKIFLNKYYSDKEPDEIVIKKSDGNSIYIENKYKKGEIDEKDHMGIILKDCESFYLSHTFPFKRYCFSENDVKKRSGQKLINRLLKLLHNYPKKPDKKNMEEAEETLRSGRDVYHTGL